MEVLFVLSRKTRVRTKIRHALHQLSQEGGTLQFLSFAYQ